MRSHATGNHPPHEGRARRYLKYLCDAGLATRTSRYGGQGRLEIEYIWRG